MSHSPMGLHSLLRDSFTFYRYIGGYDEFCLLGCNHNPHSAAGNVAVQSYNVTESFHRNL
jgi:hypothetical protein